jgi:hypothetical protein
MEDHSVSFYRDPLYRIDPWKPPSEAEVVARAQMLLEKGWTRRASAVDKNGKAVSPWSVGAVRFSATGALMRASTDLGLSYTWFYASKISERIHPKLRLFNDCHTKKEVLGLLELLARRAAR